MSKNLVTALSLTIFTSFLYTSCKQDETDSKIKIQFNGPILSLIEGSQSKVTLKLEHPALKQEFVNIKLSSLNAVYGTDFSIDNSVNLANTFSLSIPKDSLTVSFIILAVADYIDEQDEIIHFEITGSSDGLIEGAIDSTDVTVKNKTRFPEDNRAISFDGIDDYIELGNIYDEVSLPITISAWVYIDSSATSSILPIFDSQDGLPLYDGFNFLTGPSSFIGIQYGDGQGENNSVYRRAKSSPITKIAGRWVNLTAIMRGATDMDCFLNGVNVGGSYYGESDLPLKSSSPSETAKIGILHQNGLVDRFFGKIDELKIWNRALTESEIQILIFKKLGSSSEGLIGYWSFDEPDGDIVNDASKNAFNGTLIGNPLRVHSGAPISE